MGIRVHKTLGYGLSDVKTEEGAGWRLADERINAECPALNFRSGPIEEYKEWLEEQREAGDIEIDLELSFLREPEPGDPHFDLDSAVIHNGEFGLPNVLCIVPPTYQRKWSRFDDTMDWIEETYLRGDGEMQKNRVDVLRHGVYPFIDYMDKRTGERLDHRIFNWVRATNATEPLSEQELDLVAEACGFESNKDAWENVAPVIPRDIANIANFLEVFTSPDVLLQLRPMIYTYWS